MSDFIKAQPGVVEAAVQTLVECRRMARRIEEALESIEPLLREADNPALEIVNTIVEAAQKTEHLLGILYHRNAKEVFGYEEKGDRTAGRSSSDQPNRRASDAREDLPPRSGPR